MLPGTVRCPLSIAMHTVKPDDSSTEQVVSSSNPALPLNEETTLPSTTSRALISAKSASAASELSSSATSKSK